MATNGRDYWTESVEASLAEAGVTATAKQIDVIAGGMEVSHEQFGMACGHDVASQNYQGAKDREIADLRKELREERDKVTCTDCKGRGSITIHGPCHSGTSQCYGCNGAGRR